MVPYTLPQTPAYSRHFERASQRTRRMHICVCVKQTPDSSSVYVDPISGQVDYERFVQVLNPADACAVEAAVRLKEQLGGTVLALTFGPEDAEAALRAAFATGADKVLRLWC